MRGANQRFVGEFHETRAAVFGKKKILFGLEKHINVGY